MKYRGVPSCSVEINPFLRFVGTVKTRNYADIDAVADEFRQFVAAAKKELQKLPKERHAHEYLSENAALVPGLHNIHRWWTPANLMQLVCLRRLLLAFCGSPEHHDLLKMGLLSILIPVSNARHNHVSLTFAEKPLETLDIGAILQEKYAAMLQDIREVQASPCADAIVYKGNSKFLSDVLAKSQKASCVITSPPYPNRFSYARETRPHLFFFDFVAGPEAVGQMEADAIGGTWGKATSVLSAGVEPKNDTVRYLLKPYHTDIHTSGSLMAHYVTKYFNDMYDHAEQLCRYAARNAAWRM